MKTLQITGPVAAYAVLATLLVAVMLCMALLVISVGAIRSERSIVFQLSETQQSLNTCRGETLYMRGRVRSLERVFVSAHHAAIEASLAEYEEATNGNTSIIDFKSWLTRR